MLLRPRLLPSPAVASPRPTPPTSGRLLGFSLHNRRCPRLRPSLSTPPPGPCATVPLPRSDRSDPASSPPNPAPASSTVSTARSLHRPTFPPSFAILGRLPLPDPALLLPPSIDADNFQLPLLPTGALRLRSSSSAVARSSEVLSASTAASVAESRGRLFPLRPLFLVAVAIPKPTRTTTAPKAGSSVTGACPCHLRLPATEPCFTTPLSHCSRV